MTGSVEPPPPFVYLELSRPEAEERLRQNQAVDGDFLVRARNIEEQDFTLVIVYKGKPTHHTLRPGPDGAFTVNKLPCGGAQSIAEVIDYFSRPVKGWPVVLKRGIPRDPEPEVLKTTQENQSAESAVVATEKVRERPKQIQLPTAEPTPVAQTFSMPISKPIEKVLAPAISAEAVAAAQEKAHEDDIRIEQELAAHAAKVKAEEAARRNSLRAERAALVRQHRTPEEEFFGGFGPNDELGLSPAERIGAAHTQSAAQAWEEREEVVALLQANVADMARVTQVEADPNSPSYLWRSCTKVQSAELLKDKPPGTFMMRKTTPPTKNSYLLDIVFNGKRTTHSVAENCDGVFTLNDKVVGQCQSVDDLIFRLKRPLKNWPIVLCEPVVDPGKCKPRVPGSASPETNPSQPTYLSPETARVDVEQLFVGETDGTFHVRPMKGSIKRGHYLLTVQFRGKPTQHSIEKAKGGVFTVNEKSMGNKTTLDELIEYLRVSRKNWPVRLTSAIRPPKVLAPDPATIDDALSQQIRAENNDIAEKLASTTAILQAARSRLDDPSASNDESMTSDVRAALSELDIRTARKKLRDAEAALDEKAGALQELRSYASAGATLPGRMVEIDPNNPSYLWYISATEAKDKLSGAADGTYLVRSRSKGSETVRLVLVFQGNVTTHELAMNDRRVFTVNGKAMGGKSTIDGVISYLSTAQRANWPVILQTPIRNPDQPFPESEAVRLAASDVAAAEVTVESARLTMALVNPDVRALSRSKAPPGAPIVDTRAVAQRRAENRLAELQHKLHDQYQMVLKTSVPILNRDHSDVLLTVMGEKIANEIRDIGNSNSTRLRQLYDLAILQRQVSSAQFQLNQAETAMAVGLAEQTRKHTATLTKLIEFVQKRLTKTTTALEAFKTQKDAVERRLRESADTGDNEEKLQSLLKEIDKANLFYKSQDDIANELRVIRSNPILMHFHVQAMATTKAVFRRIQAVYNKRRKLEVAKVHDAHVDGVSTVSGFIPLLPISSTCMVAQLCDSGVLRAGETQGKMLSELCATFSRVVTYRYQDQIRLLSAFDAQQFAQWFSVPIVCAITRELPRPRKVLIDGESLRKAKFDSHLGPNSPLTVSLDGAVLGTGLNRLRPGDVVVALNGTPCRTVEGFQQEICRVEKGQEVSLTLAASETSMPSTPDRLALFLVRLIESVNDELQPLGEGASRTLGTVEAITGTLNHGSVPLWLFDYATHAEPSDLVRKSGTGIEDGDEVTFYHNPGETDVATYGYRRPVPSTGPIYANQLSELNRLGWIAPRRGGGPPSYQTTAHVHRKASFRSALSIGAPDSGAHSFDEPLWNPVETIALAKTAEAEDLALQVLQLKQEVSHLNQMNGKLSEQLATATGAPLPVKFKSSLHKHKK